MTDISRLIEKLEAATEGSIGLDVEVMHACGYGNSDDYPKTDANEWLKPTRSFDDYNHLFSLPQCGISLGWPGWMDLSLAVRACLEKSGNLQK